VGKNNLGEALGLRPGAAVVADDGGGAEVLAIDLAQQVVVDVRLPRHLAPRPSSSFSGDDFASSTGALLGSHAVSRWDGWNGGAGEYIGCVVWATSLAATGRGMEPYFSTTSLYQFFFSIYWFYLNIFEYEQIE
jgi:hypothetical protein